MANTPIELPKLPADLLLVCDVYPRGSDVADETSIALTQAAARDGTYSGIVSASSSGLVSVKVKAGSSLIGEITGSIEDTSDKFILEDGDRIIAAL